MERVVRGLSLLEVVVSAGILFVIMIVLLNLVATSVRGTSAAEKRLVAESIALSMLEKTRSRPFGTLNENDSETLVQKFEGTHYRIAIRASQVSGHSPAHLKSIHARVSWNGNTGKENIELTGYVTPLLR